MTKIFKINFKCSNGENDSLIVEGHDFDEVRSKANYELEKRNATPISAEWLNQDVLML